MVAPRSLIFAATAASIVACTSASSPSAGDAPIAGDAGSADAPAEAHVPPPPLLPYPPGPYGARVGDALGDFHVVGYAMSRAERDVTKLPFRDITLAEVRSDPKCTCLVVIWSTAGITCVPSIEGRNAIATMVSGDESLCALDVVWDTLDSGPGQVDGYSYRPQPATRADLEATCEGTRPPFPAGLATDEAVDRLGANPITGIPDFYVVRTKDMRISAVFYGGDNLPGRIRAACAEPHPGPELLSSDVSPTALVLDATHAIVADAGGRVVRIPRGGGAVETLAETPAAAAELTQDDANIYWAEPGVIARASKSGGGRVVMTTIGSTATSTATDGAYVYLTHVDGTIGSVSVAGGPETTLFSGEARPVSILADGTQIYWLAKDTGEVFAAAKDGTAKKKIVEASDKKRAQILFVGEDVVVRDDDFLVTGQGHSFVASTKSGDSHDPWDPDFGLHIFATWDAAAGVLDVVYRSNDLARGSDVAIGRITTTRDASGRHPADYVTLGVHDFTAIASGGDGYVYFTTKTGLWRIRR